MTEEILALIEERPYTIRELAATLGVNHWTLRDRIAQLSAHGKIFIETHGSGKASLVRLPLDTDPLPSAPTKTPAQDEWHRRTSAMIGHHVSEAIAKKEHPPSSWWVGLARDAFYREATQRSDSMSASKIGLSVTPQILAWKGQR